jgi:DNA polymerase-4
MPLRHLFVDMNAYFASVEQHDRPELRGKPVAVVAVMTDRTCCLAASYEAKRFGIKTGTGVREARQMCRGLKIVEARPPLYVWIHGQIVEAVDAVIHVEKVYSIDEMSCRLNPDDRTPERAAELAREVKRSIAHRIGPTLRCSVGIAPNVLLAKVASDIQKPDGLTILEDRELPERMFSLTPRDLPGIGSRMEERLRKAGIHTMEQLYAATVEQLARVWNSRLLGETWWRRIRGEDLPEVPTHRRTVGHSHVLPPEFRSDAGARAVMTRLLHRAAARLRRLDYWTGALSIRLDYLGGGGWHETARFPPVRDTLSLLESFDRLWPAVLDARPLKVSLTLHDLAAAAGMSLPLFPEDRVRSTLADAMDSINERLDTCGICFGGMLGAEHTAPLRIPFAAIPELHANQIVDLSGVSPRVAR